MTTLKTAYLQAKIEQIDTLVANSTLEEREHSYSGDSYLYELEQERTYLITTLGGTRWT